jgi:hypothetical protein
MYAHKKIWWEMMPWKSGFERSVAKDAIRDVANTVAMKYNCRGQKNYFYTGA